MAEKREGKNSLKPEYNGCTQRPFISDDIVLRAIDFIKANACRQLQVADVADSVSVCRRELERRFKKALNRSVHSEIKLTRVLMIRRLLVETEYNISEIAIRMGFSSVSHIGRYFKDIYGISPAEYRKRKLNYV